MPDNPRYYRDFTGTGNSLNVTHAQTLKLIADSLRYWVQEMHVDGFRFDLVITLGREPEAYDPGAAFFDIVHQDPVLSRVKLIAEPWDVGDFGYQVGNMPVLWSEWNGKYRDNVRKFWKGDPGQIAELAYRLSGSSDLYRLSGRGPTGSINFITAHDGFTLRDLVSYNDKHNDANGENNQDGANDNNSWNSGVEGPVGGPERRRTAHASPALVAGDAVSVAGRADAARRRRDSAARSRATTTPTARTTTISWFDWNLERARSRTCWSSRAALIAFRRGASGAASAALLRRAVPARRGHQGPDLVQARRHRDHGRDVGRSRSALAWRCAWPVRRSTSARPRAAASPTRRCWCCSTRITKTRRSRCPRAAALSACVWERLMDTEQAGAPAPSGEFHAVGGTYTLVARALALFRRVEASAHVVGLMLPESLLHSRQRRLSTMAW